jgi:hypothetical protein
LSRNEGGGVDDAVGSTQIPGMTQLAQNELRDIGLTAAHEVLGDGAQDVDFKPALDAQDQPAYFVFFSFQLDQDRQRASLLKTRLSQAIRDKLIDRGDAHYPFVRLLAARDWVRRHDAGAN